MKDRPPVNDVEKINPMNNVISILLIAGVLTSAVVLFVGLVLLLATGRTGYGQPVNVELLQSLSGKGFPHSVGDVLGGVADQKPFAVIELGVLILLATPVVRVAASVVLFALEDDLLYVGLTLGVLILLLVSIFWIG